ncbi:rod shape-determining protein MreC [bacterium]|nr:rod shape-determining protein MreC [bacterium]
MFDQIGFSSKKKEYWNKNMLWRFRKEIILFVFIYFSFLVNRFYLSRNFSESYSSGEKKIINYSEIIEENKRLKKILKLKEGNYLNKFIVSKVVSFIPYIFPAELIVNRGENDNVESGMVVITEDLYLVGKVEKVEKNVSYVSTIFNANSKVSIVVSSTKEVGIVEGGTTPFLLLKYISSDSKIKIGDEIITSGYSEFYPSGIKVGKVVKIEKQKNSLFLKIYIKPYCMFSYLKEVLIGKEENNKDI